MTEVFERVLLGNRHDACDLILFNEQKIGLVVNVTDNIDNHFEGCSHVKRKIPKREQTDEMISLSQSSTGEVIFDSEGRNITPTKQSQELLGNPLLFDDEESNSSMCETTPLRETLFTTTTSESDYLAIPSQVSDSSDFSSAPSDPMLTFDDENSIMSSVSASENDPLLIDQTSMSSVIREEASNNSQATPQKSQDEPVVVFATPKSKAKTPKKSSQKKERKKAVPVYEYVKLDHTVMYHKISIEDSREKRIVEYFDEAISKIEIFLENHPDMKVMIHCREGKSRSVSTLIAYGMKSLKLSLHDCYNHVTKKLEGNDRINDGFKYQLMDYELQLLKARSFENPDIAVVNSFTFFEKRGRGRKMNYSLNDDNDDKDDVDYDEEDNFEEEDDNEDEDDGDYEEKKKKPKKKTGGRKKKGPQFAKDWKDIDIQESKPQKGKQLSLFDMFTKKNKPAPTIAAEPTQPSKQASLDSLFSPKKPKKSSTKKSSSAKKLDFDNLPQEATIPEVKEATSNNVVTEPIVLIADDNKMDTTEDIKTLDTTSKSESSEIEKSEVKDGKKKKKEKDQNKSTKKVFKRTPRFSTPEEPVVVEEPKKKEESKKRKKTEESESKTESKKKKTKKEKSKKDKKKTASETEAKPSSDESAAQPTTTTTEQDTAPTGSSSEVMEQAPLEAEKPKKVEKPKTGGLFKYFKPKTVTTQ
ncbi:predicted protein [Naegleria gruberi]|uniref:protein-tyrosine-phosphatase n=1 Tax=Naegleria gruberi TaxID=5762 RepID=D2V744_NAEGR|nr:uncharacterized protein NAEGRDRAFT_64664 [Naegleria gruberi]EFC47195.1 predicted protein [Naegleria gruberi]|eukprot:XP_002679939.1 predicted protein [Naegleria gruberi strain NEG-M]